MRRSVSRRHALTLLGAVSVAGCSGLLSSKNESSFTDGSAEWSRNPPSIADDSWPMIDRTLDGAAYTPASGPTAFPLEQAWTAAVDESIVRPIVRNGTVFLSLTASDGTIVALNAVDGAELWRVTRDELSGVAPATSEELLFAPFGHYKEDARTGVTAFEASSGTETWHHAATDIDENVLITESSVLLTGLRARIVALDQESGELAWEFTPGDPNYGATGVAITDNVYFATAGSKTDYPDVGFVYALDPDAGELAWSIEFDSPVTDIAVTEGTVLATAGETLTALTTDTGSKQWTRSLDSTGGVAVASKEGLVIGSSRKNLVAYDISTGNRRWKTPGTADSQVAIADNIVYATAGQHSGPGITAYELQSGKQLWAVPGGSMSPPTIANNRLFVGTGNGEITAWE